MAKKKPSEEDKPKVNRDLEGFDIKIDTFGEIKSSYDIEKINEFLNKNVDDKKLRDRADIKNKKKNDAEDDNLKEEKDNS